MQRRDAAGLQSCRGNIAMEQQQQQEDEQQSHIAAAPTALVSVPTPAAHAPTATVPAPLQAPVHARHQQIIAPCQASIAKPYKLSTTDRAAIKSYSTHGYQAINGQIRGIKKKTKKIQSFIQTLTRLFEHPMALDVCDGKVHQGMGMPAHVFEALQPGSTYSEASFLSTSKELVQVTFFVLLCKSGETCHKPTA
jgi:hypothetical protein